MPGLLFFFVLCAVLGMHSDQVASPGKYLGISAEGSALERRESLRDKPDQVKSWLCTLQSRVSGTQGSILHHTCTRFPVRISVQTKASKTFQTSSVPSERSPARCKGRDRPAQHPCSHCAHSPSLRLALGAAWILGPAHSTSYFPLDYAPGGPVTGITGGLWKQSPNESLNMQ